MVWFPAPAQLIPSSTEYPFSYWSTCQGSIQNHHWRGTSPSRLTEVSSRGWGLIPFSQWPCQCPHPRLRIPAAWLPCPLTPSCWPHYPSTTAARWQCARLGGGWNLSTCLTAHWGTGTGTGWWSLSLSPAMTLAHRHPSRSGLLSLRLSLVLRGRQLPAQVGHWVQSPCLWLELELQQLPCLPDEPGPHQWLQQPWWRSGGLWLPAGLEGLQGRPGGTAICSACCFVSSLFPFRALNQVEQGSVGVGQTPGHCGDLCLSRVPSVATHFLQIFY